MNFHTSSIPEITFPSFNEGEDWDANSSDALCLNGSSLDYDIPFAPFAKTDRLGRIADWAGPSVDSHSSSQGQGRRTFPRGGTAPKATEDEEAGWSFAADAKSMPRDKKSTGMGATKGPMPAGKWDGRQKLTGRGGHMAGKRGGGWGSRFADRMAQRKREPSVIVSSEWRIIEEIEFNRLAKLQLDPDDSIPIKTVGSTFYYDKAADKIDTRQEKLISTPSNSPVRVILPPVEEDKIMLGIARDENIQIIAPDHIAALLMAAPRTTLPWDVLIKRRGELVILDSRLDCDIDLLPVNETSPDAPPDDRASADTINSASSLARETARLALNIPSVLTKADDTLAKFDVAPQLSKDENVAVRYAKLDLGDGAVMLVRSHISSVLRGTRNDENDIPMHMAALLEYEHKGASGMDWRLKLDNQRGAVFAHEIRNHGAALARIVFKALLSAIEHIKLAYFSRVSVKDTTRHALLGVHEFEPYELANQMNLNVPNGFGVLRTLIDLCRRLPTNCDYILMRDPNKATLRLYKLPGGDTNAFDDAVDELVGATDKVHISEPSDVSDSDSA